MIQYACCEFQSSESLPYINGKMAPPAIAMINKAEPILVNLPSPVMANGKMAGHIRELASPNAAMKPTEKYPEVTIAATEKTIPSKAQIFNAFDCERYFGIVKIPTT